MVKFLKYDMQMPNPYSQDPIWIGDRYSDPTNELRGALILGVAPWGEPPPADPQWIRYFIEKKATKKADIDRSFSRLHWIMTDETISDSCNYIELYERSSSAELERWFNLFAFYNYVSKSVGPTNASKVTSRQLADARQPFREALQMIDPKGVWIMGKRQVKYSEEIIEQYGINSSDREIMIPHVCLVSNVGGRESWRRFGDIMRRINPAAIS
jgi:hypothetical protein